MNRNIVVPDLGNLLEGEVIEINFHKGDKIKLGDIFCSIEADKATFDIESNYDGTIDEIKIDPGAKVKSGDILVIVREERLLDSNNHNKDADIETQKTKNESENLGTLGISNNNILKSQYNEIELKIPDFGADTADVIEVNFKVGDTVKKDNILFTIESEKASIDIPVEYSGEIIKSFISVGSSILQSQVYAVIKVNDMQQNLDNIVSTEFLESSDSKNQIDITQKEIISTTTNTQTQVRTAQFDVDNSDENTAELNNLDADDKYYYLNNLIQINKDKQVYAGPGVRRLARELGINLQSIKGSGNNHRILKEDLYLYSKEVIQRKNSEDSSNSIKYELPDFSQFGEIEFEEFNKVQKVTIKSMAISNQMIPQVTQFESVDITDLEKFRKELKEKENKKLSILPFIIKAMSKAIIKMPKFNSSVDIKNSQNIYKKFINIGVAVDTEYGLFVPVIKNVDQLTIFEIGDEIIHLSQKARQNKLTISEISGSTISVSSLGNLGGQHFTPIVNAPEVAILGISKSSWQYVVANKDDSPQNRLILPLSCSYDHRIINGADGVRFICYLKYLLEDYRRISL